MLNVAVAGFGWWGRHIVTRLAGRGGIRVIAVAEPVEALHEDIRAHRVEPVADYAAVLADPRVEAVVLTTPHMLHEEQVRQAAAAGKHVFCEKPLGITAASARRSVAACRQAGVVLGIGHERRFEPAMRRLKAMLEAGELGTIMHAEAAFSHDKLAGIPAGGWRTSKELSPGAGMTGMGIHLTDLLLWMFGPVETVQAQIRDRTLGWPTGDMVVAQLGFRAGMTAHLQAILNTPHFMRFHVFGSDGWVEIRNGTHPDTPGGVTDWLHCPKGGEPRHERLEWTDAVVANLEAFAEAIAGCAAYPWSEEELVGNIAVYEAIVRAADSGDTARPG
ncbi:Gfo/Idh/MocA family oxidoreductase [Chelativorans sp. M5D2P16]|uniref:Gfo/Idh/MocA family protein n=1 Tax=Chelativorans sp. M5D2P16 TaxID=3095678 RepID=UPI002ACAE7A6|nr:Gfo/Idh/MocA family oxidoreductase [Chelativorans sp. M5D2P16]MDZ5696639.1 Gfo/Idh/MocA family oxidoreductase [Chelativorans sp. M5D2P16]